MADNKHFFKDNLYLLIGTGVINLTGFLFHFYMGRTLGPESYGVLATLIALTALMGILATTFQFSISKFVTLLHLKKQTERLRYLYSDYTKKMIYGTIIAFVLLLIVNIFLSSYLRIPYYLLFISILAILVVPELSIVRGFLQGLQHFRTYGMNLAVEGTTKLIAGILLVILGYSVGGALVAIILSYALATIYGIRKIKTYIQGTKESFPLREIYKYTLPMFVTVLFFTAFYSLDLFLIKHFFPAIDAGHYAVISLIGKIVFFASFSIVQVMFPKVVELSEQGGAHKSLMWKSAGIIGIITVPIILGYHFFGTFVVQLLFGSAYLSVTPLIVPYGIFMATISFSKLFSLYLLSLKKYTFLYLFAFFLALELILIYLYHDTLAQVVTLLQGVGAILFIALFFIVWRVKNE